MKTERLHSLDSLRAIMMLLGLVLHSAVTYGYVDFGDAWPIKDGATSVSNDFIVALIHSFRMPVFFLIAGFFGSMLFYERKPLAMIKNRISRLLYPFLVFLLVLWPINIFAFGYTKLVFAGSANALSETMLMFSNPFTFIPHHAMHLWFLYYLILITGVVVLLALLLKTLPGLTKYVHKKFRWIVQKPIIRVLFFSFLTFSVYISLGIREVGTTASFFPNFNTFFFYIFFYIVGWILFKSKDVLASLMSLDWICTLLGIVLFSIYFFSKHQLDYIVAITLSSFIVWLFIFGITGLFIRFGSNYSSKMRYISDSSYWVYLIHLSFTALLPSLLIDWEVPATLKFLTVLIGTTLICFVTYHYFVRSSFIGKFLNGRKY